MSECPECYSLNQRATPLLNKRDCLTQHKQYICGTCGRCICIESDDQRNLQRWNFPFKSLSIAKLYLRTAEITMNQSCGIYEILSKNNRVSYKIFVSDNDYLEYLAKTKKTSNYESCVFRRDIFQTFENFEIRKLSNKEIDEYLEEM